MALLKPLLPDWYSPGLTPEFKKFDACCTNDNFQAFFFTAEKINKSGSTIVAAYKLKQVSIVYTDHLH
jgi:hypothetical protein